MAAEVPQATAVVLLVFNRPETTARVVESIRRATPGRLLVVADGPRPGHPGDAERCRAARAVVDQVDWPCPVERDYAETNLGCARRVASGLDWAFARVDEAIVLEDDCVPHPTFFPFCRELLAHYRDDSRVMAISGDNFQHARPRDLGSYSFSRYPHCWGWATWRRAWRHYDPAMSQWARVRDEGWLDDLLGDRAAARAWTRIFDATHAGRVDSWAYRWTLSCWLESGLTVLPAVNLVANIGFAADATHTTAASRFAELPTAALDFPLRHPPFMIRDARADACTQASMFSPSLSQRVRGKLASLRRRWGSR